MDIFQISTSHNKTPEPVCRTRQDSYTSTTGYAAVEPAFSDHHLRTVEVQDLSDSEMTALLQQPVAHWQIPCMEQPVTLASVYSLGQGISIRM